MLSYKEAIKIRRSIRSYSTKPIEKELLIKIEELLKSPITGPFGNKSRFSLIEKSNVFKNSGIKLSTFGLISKAQYFIGGVVEKFEYSEVDYGYSLERIIIELTRMELDTCWLGNAFKRKDYETLLNAKDNEIVPCITPVGYKSKKINLKHRILRLNKKTSRKKFEELFFENNPETPLEYNRKYKYNQALELIRLAPSSMNKQPWRVIKTDNKYHFYIDRNNKEPVNKSIDLLKVDIGIALSHFKIAVEELSLEGKWHINNPEISNWEYIITWIAN